MLTLLNTTFIVIILIGTTFQSTYFLQIPSSLKNKLKRNEEISHPRLQMLAIRQTSIPNRLHTGFKYSHFKTLVEKNEQIVGEMQPKGEGLGDVKNMHCSCKFKKLFVHTIEEPVEQLKPFHLQLHPHKIVKTELTGEELKKVKLILKRKIDSALENAKDVKQVAEQVKTIKEIMKSTAEMRKLLKKESEEAKKKGFKVAEIKSKPKNQSTTKEKKSIPPVRMMTKTQQLKSSVKMLATKAITETIKSNLTVVPQYIYPKGVSSMTPMVNPSLYYSTAQQRPIYIMGQQPAQLQATPGIPGMPMPMRVSGIPGMSGMPGMYFVPQTRLAYFPNGKMAMTPFLRQPLGQMVVNPVKIN